MDWGSTTPGEWLTGSQRWRAILGADRLTILINAQTALDVHYVQVCSFQVHPGAIWARCDVDYMVGSTVSRLSVDGIPNERATELRAAVHQRISRSLAALVSGSSGLLDTWLARALGKLDLTLGKFVGQAEVEAALADGSPPSTPGAVRWDSLFRHELIQAARSLGDPWPQWSAGPTDELIARTQVHNAASFKAAYDRWHASTTYLVGRGRWIPKGMASKLIAKCPAPEWPGRTWKEAVGDASPLDSLQQLFEKENVRHRARQRKAQKAFFDSVEVNPLTDEQIDACICMDDRVMVVAAAGSGKTSTMVAKTGYVLQQGLASPSEILLLAFNRATAEELEKRLCARLRDVPGVEQVRSKTFHSFGIEVIGFATGKKPSLASWVDPSNPGADLREIADIVQSLSKRDRKFRLKWNLFRTVFARDVGKWGRASEPDAFENGRRGFRTARGEIVKSKEECVIANWLFYNSVAYEYERAYEHDTADATHRQYFPDFYYPAAKLYHEHFALNQRGEAPEDFKDYLAGVAWKRKLHVEKRTDFIETTSYTLRSGEGLETLAAALEARGVTLSFDADRMADGDPPARIEDLARLFRVFQQHVKNNGLTKQALRGALMKQWDDGFGVRLSLFLDLYERVSDEWEKRLCEAKAVDFEDMLIQAAEHVEAGRFKSPYAVVLADEFQDCSRARIRLLKALANRPNGETHLCVVGDDWQGINRFAGSDISVMAEFDKVFEDATRLTLGTTFRCPQEICDVSGAFVSKNRVQIRKQVRTTNPLTKSTLLAYACSRREAIDAEVEEQLAELYLLASEGKITSRRGPIATVMLLGRYRNDRPAALGAWQARYQAGLKIDFHTVHGSKGLEADYVFVLNVMQGTRGFPSEIEDDPVLQLAMPAPEAYPFAEERRLFYVALTRARKQVRLYTTQGQPSEFLLELRKDGAVEIVSVDGTPLDACPECGRGVLVQRAGPRGSFLGCSRFPRCSHTRNEGTRGKQDRPPKPTSQRIRRPVQQGDPCPICGQGVMRLTQGRNGPFLGCSRFRQGCRATANLLRDRQ